jgi:alpha-L-fucosidase
MKKIITTIFFSFVLIFVVAAQSYTPELPSKSHLKWADAEIGVLIHFDLPVFEPTYNFRKNWNYHPDLSIFNPKELNTDQWIQAAKSAGATYAVLVAKHCTGFSLWPTKAHPYSVKNTPWRNGQGDIVKDFIASCKKYGVKPGIYASASANGYMKVDDPGRVVSGNPEEQKAYNEIVKTQLTELWSQYGPLFEVWFDGGVLPPDKGGIDMLSLLKKYQPDAIAFQGPYGFANNIRWVGNEEGVAPIPCWSKADTIMTTSGLVEIRGLNGNPDGLYWCPGETDFPLRKNSSFEGGWFWHKNQDDQIRPLEEVVDRYLKSVGRNTNMLLGMVVDDRGLVPEVDVKRLNEFGTKIKSIFNKPIAEKKGTGKTMILELNKHTHISHVVIMEDLVKGERIREYEIFGKIKSKWVSIAKGESVGHKKIETVNGEYTALKLEVLKSEGLPQIKNLACY